MIIPGRFSIFTVLSVFLLTACGGGDVGELPPPADILPVANTAAQPLESLRPIHAIAIYPADPARLYLAAGNGLYLTDSGGQVQLIGRESDKLVTLLTVSDTNEALLVSGHPAMGGNLGLLRSINGGRSWEDHSGNADDPMGFELLASSAADPKRIYGIYQGLRTSEDSGKTWLKVADAPTQLFDLAVSQQNPQVLYAATGGGLYLSQNGGKSWSDPFQFKLPVTMVRTTTDGLLYAFVVSKGLLRTAERANDWLPLNNEFGMQIFTRMVVHPENSGHLYALNQFNRVLATMDGGKSWHSFAGDRKPETKNEIRGQQLYSTHCKSCHGAMGVGETYSPQALTDKDYFMAPALDDSMHAWHHTDDALVNTILNGSPRKSRMIALKNILSEADAHDIVQYMKSLWGTRALDCQGPKHMQCM